MTRWLSSAEAEAYLSPFAAEFSGTGKRIGMDVDRKVLTHGRNGKGAALFPGGRFDFAELFDERGSTFIDGDLVLDGWAENVGGLVFVRGNLIAQSLFSTGYLIVAGELRVRRFFGAGEQYGTFVFGDATIESVALAQNHHFDVWGEATIGEEVDDERDGRAALGARLHEWGVLDDPTNVDFMIEAPPKLRAWAQGCGKLPEDWAKRKWTPKPRTTAAEPAAPPVAVAPAAPPPRSEVVLELERFFDTTKLTQREQLAALKAEWVGRLGPDDHAEAKRLIKRAINSKKLVAERDELLAALG